MTTITYHNVSRETFELADDLIQANRSMFELYVDKLLWWNEKINLISRDVSRETIWEHVRHSLLLSSFNAFKQAKCVVDAGTGGGLPGIPLALAHPKKEFILNDIVSKKIMAVKQMKRELSLTEHVKTVSKSIEEVRIENEFLLISKHAFKIRELYKFTAHLPWTAIALYKSIDIADELDEVKVPLNITIHKLFPNSDNSFYKGKGIVIIRR